MQIQTAENTSFKEFSTKPWIEIKELLTVTPSNARVYIQNGMQIPPSKLNQYAINCEIEVRKVLELTQTVEPGKFEITRISTNDSSVVFLEHSNIQYAMGGGRSSRDIKRSWKFTLQSDKDPDVMFMHCRGAMDNESNAELPTLEEIKQAVGNIIQVHLVL